MENVDSIVLELLKALRSDVSGMRSEMQTEFKDVKARLNHMESSVAGLRRDNAITAEDSARQQVSIDHIVERIQRIERRLELQ